MESTVMISSLLCNILIGCFCLMIVSLTISGIQTIVNEHKREKREEKKAQRKPLSKYANRKGASHKGRNDRSRRQKARGTKSNLGHRAKPGRPGRR